MWQKYIPFLPLSAVGVAFATILTCFALSQSHLPPDFLPPISFTGYLAPERYVYAFGFTAVFLLFLASAAFILKELLLTIEHTLQKRALWCFGMALCAFIGFEVQSVVPLQADMLEVFTNPGFEVSAQSIVHQSGAAVFFLCSLIHCGLWLSILKRSKKVPFRMLSNLIVARYVAAATAVIPTILSIIWHPTMGAGDKATMDFAAITQYLTVLSLIAFYGMYYFDLKLVYGAGSPRRDL